jgi:hypothetical protein
MSRVPSQIAPVCVPSFRGPSAGFCTSNKSKSKANNEEWVPGASKRNEGASVPASNNASLPIPKLIHVFANRIGGFSKVLSVRRLFACLITFGLLLNPAVSAATLPNVAVSAATLPPDVEGVRQKLLALAAKLSPATQLLLEEYPLITSLLADASAGLDTISASPKDKTMIPDLRDALSAPACDAAAVVRGLTRRRHAVPPL